MPTIAFDNKNNFWKSNYSYETNCFGSNDKRFVSFRDAPVSLSPPSICWEHKKSSPKNKFYTFPAQKSKIGVSFNDAVSANKIYKSLSIEGGRIDDGEVVNMFRANSDHTVNKTASVGTVKQKGGISYAHVGGVATNGQSNFETLGVLSSYQSVDLETILLGIDGGDLSNVIETSKIILFDTHTNQFIHPFGAIYYELDFSSVTGPYNEVKSEVKPLRQKGFFSNDGGLFVTGVKISVFQQLSEKIENGAILVCHVTPTYINGDMPRGQYAEAVFLIPPKDFEIYAFNLNYEPTDLDHSK